MHGYGCSTVVSQECRGVTCRLARARPAIAPDPSINKILYLNWIRFLLRRVKHPGIGLDKRFFVNVGSLYRTAKRVLASYDRPRTSDGSCCIAAEYY